MKFVAIEEFSISNFPTVWLETEKEGKKVYILVAKYKNKTEGPLVIQSIKFGTLIDKILKSHPSLNKDNVSQTFIYFHHYIPQDFPISSLRTVVIDHGLEHITSKRPVEFKDINFSNKEIESVSKNETKESNDSKQDLKKPVFSFNQSPQPLPIFTFMQPVAPKPIPLDFMHQGHHTFLFYFELLGKDYMWRPSNREGYVVFVTSNPSAITSLFNKLKTLIAPDEIITKKYFAGTDKFSLECKFEKLKATYGNVDIYAMDPTAPAAAPVPLDKEAINSKFKDEYLPNLMLLLKENLPAESLLNLLVLVFDTKNTRFESIAQFIAVNCKQQTERCIQAVGALRQLMRGNPSFYKGVDPQVLIEATCSMLTREKKNLEEVVTKKPLADPAEITLALPVIKDTKRNPTSLDEEQLKKRAKKTSFFPEANQSQLARPASRDTEMKDVPEPSQPSATL